VGLRYHASSPTSLRSPQEASREPLPNKLERSLSSLSPLAQQRGPPGDGRSGSDGHRPRGAVRWSARVPPPFNMPP
jgi:hypothetical protein